MIYCIVYLELGSFTPPVKPRHMTHLKVIYLVKYYNTCIYSQHQRNWYVCFKRAKSKGRINRWTDKLTRKCPYVHDVYIYRGSVANFALSQKTFKPYNNYRLKCMKDEGWYKNCMTPKFINSQPYRPNNIQPMSFFHRDDVVLEVDNLSRFGRTCATVCSFVLVLVKDYRQRLFW